MSEVFITDGLLRKSLTALRSLGSKGIFTTVGEKSWFSPSLFSKYCNSRVKYPDPEVDPDVFFQWLTEWLIENNRPAFFPMDDAVMDIVINHVEEINKLSKCLLPSKDSYKVASDKFETLKLANKLSINIPKTIFERNEENIIELANTLQYPLIIKPRKSSGSRGIRKIESADEFIKTLPEIELEYPNSIIQEYIPLGDRFDVCLLYDQNHSVQASFVQKELRHFPVKMGPSTVQESVFFKDLIETTVRLLKPLNWSGIVEVEFMMDSRTNEPVLMEINPRFWNSLDLSVQCGIDFPYMLYQLCQGEEILNPGVDTKYEVGRKSRWSFPGDFLHFLLNPDRFSMDPPFLAGKKQRVYDDTFCLLDPIPGLVLLLACFRFAFSIKHWKKFFKR
ncbi:MAG: ATP-grasp domain-containing protein [Bacillota bacterium]|nr:ATP-grasp domain-containing protein [Bacillota bacterium]